MNIKHAALVFLTVMALVIGLSACERSLAPKVTNTPAASLPANPTAPVGTGDVMSQLELFVTQTAMALQAGGKATPQPPVATGVSIEPQQPAPTAAEALAAPTTPAPAEELVEPEEPEPTAIIVPTATPGLPKKYTLEKNEFPYCIARRFDIDPSALLNANGLGPNSLVYEGMVLQIPQNAQSFPGKRELRSHPTVHTVAAGETINSIACLYGDVDPNVIAYANGLEAPFRISAGQKLQIP